MIDSVMCSCTPEMMTVLLILSNADITILIDAIGQGGVIVLDKLYDHNKSDCENAIIQLIKQKISYFNGDDSSITSPSTFDSTSITRN